MNQMPLNLAPQRHIWTVSEITSRIRGLLESSFTDIWLEGEVSNFKASQPGHLYFTLKDSDAQMRCVCFRDAARRLKFRPEDGMHILVRGSVSVYDVRGEYQLYVAHIEPVGQGALQLAFEQLKKKLDAEGLFDPARKKPIPVLPRCIGIVTSPTGAAVRDILRVLNRRFPNASVLIFPVRVQGEGAAAEIAAAVGYFNRAASVDVMILARGGGSLEDLWSFNEESVARAIAASRIPVISGIGHETDFTIADFVADLRAPTPSAAAEIVVRQKQEFERHIAEMRERMMERLRYRFALLHRRLQELRGRRGFRAPQDILRRRSQRLDELTSAIAENLRRRIRVAHQRTAGAQGKLQAFSIRRRAEALRLRIAGMRGEVLTGMERLIARKRRVLTSAQVSVASADLRARVVRLRGELEAEHSSFSTAIRRDLVNRRRRLDALGIRLEERNPDGLLERGYAIAYDATGKILRSPDQVSSGDEIAVRIARGEIAASVSRKRKIGRE